MTQDRRIAGREPSLAELTGNARYAADRVALYRRKLFIGQGQPRRLAELERIADGAAARLRSATTPSTPSHEEN
jgi:hypothetical protein